ncbi:MAG: hypothetical protein NTV07_00805, partial [Candidatus Omnitrophica bacterium]|nr:hypothetical protein [Candidatus Omnitrophota bacterium]
MLSDPRLALPERRLSRETAERIFKNAKWKPINAYSELRSRGFWKSSRHGETFLDVFERADVLEVFREKFLQKVKEYDGAYYKLAAFFRVHESGVTDFFNDPRIFPKTDLTERAISDIFDKCGWRVKEAAKEFLAIGVKKKKGDDFVDIFIHAKAIGIFRKAFLKKANSCNWSAVELAKYFGLSNDEFFSLLKDKRLALPERLIPQQELLRIFEANNWKLKKTANALINMGVIKPGSNSDLAVLKNANAFQIFDEKFSEKMMEFKGDLRKVGKFFGLKPYMAGYFLRNAIVVPRFSKLTNEEASEIFEKCNWRVDKAAKEFSGRCGFFLGGTSYVDIFEKAGALQAFKSKFIKMRHQYPGKTTKMAGLFGTRKRTVQGWLADPRLSAKTDKTPRKNFEEILERHGWDIDAAFADLSEYGWGVNVFILLDNSGCADLLYGKLGSLYKETNYNLPQLIEKLHPRLFSAGVAMRINRQATQYFKSFRRSLLTGKQKNVKGVPVTDKQIRAVFMKHNGDIKKSCDELASAYGTTGYSDQLKLLEQIFAAHILKDEFIEAYCETRGDKKAIAAKFGVDEATIDELKARLTPQDRSLKAALEKNNWKIRKTLDRSGYRLGLTPIDEFFARYGLYEEFRLKTAELFCGEAGFSLEKLAQLLNIERGRLYPALKRMDLWALIPGIINRKTGVDMSAQGLTAYCAKKSWNIPGIIEGLGIRYSKRSAIGLYLFDKLGMNDILKAEIRKALVTNQGVIDKTAEYFNISEQTIINWIKIFGLKKELKRIIKGKRRQRSLNPQEEELKRIVDSGDVEKMARICGRPERAFALLSAIHGA